MLRHMPTRNRCCRTAPSAQRYHTLQRDDVVRALFACASRRSFACAACRKDARYARALARLFCLGLARCGGACGELGGGSEGSFVGGWCEALADEAPAFGVLGADLGIDQPRRSDAAHLRALSSTARDAVALVARDRVAHFWSSVYAPGIVFK